LRGLALVQVAGTAVVSRDSAPSPDIMVLRYRDDFYAHANPQPGDILALVELSYSTLRNDRRRKPRLYANCGIGEYWIVDLSGQTIERCRQPVGVKYSERVTFRHREAIAFAAFPDAIFQVDELPGPEE